MTKLDAKFIFYDLSQTEAGRFALEFQGLEQILFPDDEETLCPAQITFI